MGYIILALILLGALFTITYLVRIIKEDTISLAYAFWGGAIASLNLVLFFAFVIDNIDKYDILTKYSLIPTYLIFHFIICGVISFLVLYIMVIIYNLFIVEKNNLIFRTLNVTLKKCRELVGNRPKFKKKLENFNSFFNPFRKMGNPIKFTLAKAIKTILLFSYLISGIIMLSFITNYLESKGIDFNTSFYKRDYDLYKTVFVTSLIPFTINYVKELNDKYESS